MPNDDVLTASDHVMQILRLKHPNPQKSLHPAVIGSAIYYLQKWTKLNEMPPDKIGAKENGNIAMAWEQTNPNMAIDVQSANQSAEILMQSADGTITKKTNEEGTDAKALETVTNILCAITEMAYGEESNDEPGEEVTTPVVGG